jgi:internalin A
METLSDDRQLVLSLFYMSSLSIKEIASSMSISPNSVGIKLHRARRQLGERVEKMMGKEKKMKIAGIPDLNLAAAIRDSIGKPDGAITEADLQSITELEAPDNNITDITGIERCVNLEKLILGPAWRLETWWENGNNRIEDISPLKGLTKLVHLNLNNSDKNGKINDISPLSSLTNLTRLELFANQISDVTPLADLTNLTYLFLWNNQISDVTPLSNLTNLAWLDLTENQIKDINPLAGLTDLTTLSLWVNQVTDLRPLSNLTGLRMLVIAGNQINDIAPLSSLTNLTYLSASSNPVDDISPLARLTNLEVLWFDSCQMHNASLLSNLTNLTFLNISGNQIIDISPLVGNKGLGEGDEVVLKGNPLNDDAYKVHIPALAERGVSLKFDPED